MGVGDYLLAVLVFAIGIAAGVGLGNFYPDSGSAGYVVEEQPSVVENPAEKLTMAELLAKFEVLEAQQPEDKDKPSPHDWVSMDNIKVYDNQVVISLPHPEWAMYLDTNSMDPVIDSSTNTLQLVPQSERSIHVGDIVAYESKYHNGVITHRVVEIGEDVDGWYAVLKGDNNPKQDPGKVRFSQIGRVVVAVIY